MPLFYPTFALGCLLMLPLTGYAQLRYQDPGQRTHWLRYAVHRIARTWLGWGVSLGLLRHDVQRSAPAKAADSAEHSGRIVVANHPSLVDVIFVLAEMPQLCCVLKAELGQIPVLAFLVRKLNYLSNNDPERLLADGAERLAAGESLLIFAEGTRTKGAQQLRFRLGAAELALRTQALVQPVIIHYHGRYLSGLGRWYEFPEQRLHYSIEIAAPIVAPVAATAAARRNCRRSFNAALESYFGQRLLHGPEHGQERGCTPPQSAEPVLTTAEEPL